MHFLQITRIGSPAISTCAARGAVARGEYACKFPGCGRAFADATALHLHARTHPDAEASAWLSMPLPPPGAAAGAATAAGTPAPAPATAATNGGTHAASTTSSGTEVEVTPLTVIIGPYAHHSSILPWHEAGAEVVLIKHDEATGDVAWPQLLAALRHAVGRAAAEAAGGRAMPRVRTLGVFTAASNVTGATVTTDAVTALCHAFGVPCVWDYAAAAPHAGLDMNPTARPTWAALITLAGESGSGSGGEHAPGDTFSTVKDAAYFSSHKFLAGPGAPGILILKRRWLTAAAPNHPGGGTVSFVEANGTPQYTADDADREEGGSPDVLGAVRAGMVWHVMRNVGLAEIAHREAAIAAAARRAWRAHPAIRLVGTPAGEHLPVVSFAVVAPTVRGVGATWPTDNSGALMHWAFMAALLNDLFGIQSRGGCLCAAPYVMALLGVDDAYAPVLREALNGKSDQVKPGVVRVSFCYAMSAAAVHFVIAAVAWVARHGAELLHLYTPVRETGEWRINRAGAHAMVADGARMLARVARGDTSWAAGAAGESGAAALVEWARAQPPTVGATGRSPAAVIAALTHGDGHGHLTSAQRGTTRPNPRRWLQDLRMDDAGRVIAPDYRVRIAFPADGSLGEDDLYDAYLAEANLLLAGVRSPPIPPSPPPATAAVVFPLAEPARWFVTAADYEAPPPGAAATGGKPWGPPTRLLQKMQLWPVEAAGGGAAAAAPPPAAAVLTDAAVAADEDAAAALNSGVLRSSLGTGLRTTVNPTYATALADGDLLWDGMEVPTLEEEGGGEPMRSSDGGMLPWVQVPTAPSARPYGATPPREPAATAAPPVPVPRLAPAPNTAAGGSKGGAVARGAAPVAAPPAAAVAGRLTEVASSEEPTAVVAISGGGGGGGGAAGAAGAGAGEAAGAGAGAGAAAPLASRFAAMTPDEYRARAKRVAAYKAALASLPPPPAPLTDNMLRAMRRGVTEFNMIRNGDRLLVALSGGKDSLTMLLLLMLIGEQLPVQFEIGAATVDPMYPGFDPSPLKAFLARLGIPYYYHSEAVMDLAATAMGRDSICSFCSRMKRGILYSTARKNGYNVLVMGQHTDDFAESFVMSAFRNGLLRTMKAAYTNDVGDIRIIRPLVYVRERQTREFATAVALPVISENCPACFAGPTERYHIKKVLAGEEAANPMLFSSLTAAMRPLMTDEGARVTRNVQLAVEAARDGITASRRERKVADGSLMPAFEGLGAAVAALLTPGHPALRGGGGGEGGGGGGGGGGCDADAEDEAAEDTASGNYGGAAGGRAVVFPKSAV